MLKKLVGLMAIAVAGLVWSGTASAQNQISGSAHDFRGDAWNGNGEICGVCHTPHNALAENPLWNHTLTGATFAPYSNPATMNVTPGQPAGVSLLCLSCHDGTVGLDSFGGNSVSPDTRITGNDLLGIDLSNDHPISIQYNDPDMALTTAASGLGNDIATDLLFGAGNDQVECGSCHDVHGTANGFLLRLSNADSVLCQTCHIK